MKYVIVIMLAFSFNLKAQEKQTAQTVTGVGSGLCMALSPIAPPLLIPAGTLLITTIVIDSHRKYYYEGNYSHTTIIGIRVRKAKGKGFRD